MIGLAVALGLLVLCALVVLVMSAAWARFFEPEQWRFDGRWARRPRLALAIDRVAFFGLNPLRALMLWLVVAALALAFVAVPAIAYLLGRL